MERKTVSEEIKYLSTSELAGTFEVLMKKLKTIEKDAKKKGFFNLAVEEDIEAYEGTYGFRIIASRLESEDEALKREALAKKSREAKAKRSLSVKETKQQEKYEEYLKLKKEFEG